MSIRLYGLVAMLCLWGSMVAFTNCADAQPAAIRPLMPGDRLPAVLFSPVLFKENETAGRADYAGKLWLIDFIHTGCGSCVAKIPFLDSVQTIYGQKVGILLVTTESTDKVAKWWLSSRYGGKRRLPVLCADTLLRQYFPHTTISHIAWLDGDGRLKVCTGSDALNWDMLQQAMAGNWHRLPPKIDLADFDRHQPLVAPFNPSLFHTAQTFPRVVLAGAIPGAGTCRGTDTLPGGAYLRQYAINIPVRSLYLGAINRSLYFPPSCIFFTRSAGAAASYRNIDSLWQATVSYEAVLPAGYNSAISNGMLTNQLNQLLGVCVHASDSLIPCLELRRVREPESVPPNRSAESRRKYPVDSLHYTWLHHAGTLALHLNNIPGISPVYDSLGAALPIRQWVPKHALGSLSEARNLVHQLGFALVPAQRRMQVLRVSNAICIHQNLIQ